MERLGLSRCDSREYRRSALVVLSDKPVGPVTDRSHGETRFLITKFGSLKRSESYLKTSHRPLATRKPLDIACGSQTATAGTTEEVVSTLSK